ncbi:MAG: hypothetical protein GX352_03800 [Clostridiales bacterium]|nr:hypothetical protein [Clostridiales bacterium]
MDGGIRYMLFFLILLILMTIGGSYQKTKFVYEYIEQPLIEEVPLSRTLERPKLEVISGETNAHKPADELIVMTFNICHGVNREGEESLDLLSDVIRDTGAQIIALQEVDSFMPRSGFKDQARIIAESLGYYYVFGETISILGVKYGNAILSQFPILEHENIKLPGSHIETRGLLSAVIDIEGDMCEVYTTHLGLNARDREQQIRAINSRIEESIYPFILMGDFNGQPLNEEMKELSPVLSDIAAVTQTESLNTFAYYSDYPNTRIDRIYVSNNIGVIRHYVKDSGISDHLMVLGVVSINIGLKGGLIASTGNNNR